MFCPIIDREASPVGRRSPGISRVVSTHMETWARRRRDARRRIDDADFDHGVRTKSVRARGRPRAEQGGRTVPPRSQGSVRTLSLLGNRPAKSLTPSGRSGCRKSGPDTLGQVRTLRSGQSRRGPDSQVRTLFCGNRTGSDRKPAWTPCFTIRGNWEMTCGSSSVRSLSRSTSGPDTFS